MPAIKKTGCGYLDNALSIVVVGASGDLAKKKTFPALLDLYRHDFLPKHVTICGYSRSNMSDEDLRTKIRPYLVKKDTAADPIVDEFLGRVHYRSGEWRRTDAVNTYRSFVDGVPCVVVPCVSVGVGGAFVCHVVLSQTHGAINLSRNCQCASHLTATDDCLVYRFKTGGYGSVEAMGNMVKDLEMWEHQTGDTQLVVDPERMTVMHGMTKANRL